MESLLGPEFRPPGAFARDEIVFKVKEISTTAVTISKLIH